MVPPLLSVARWALCGVFCSLLAGCLRVVRCAMMSFIGVCSVVALLWSLFTGCCCLFAVRRVMCVVYNVLWKLLNDGVSCRLCDAYEQFFVV